MADRVNVVQIILEGKNNLKGALAGARGDLKKFNSSIQAAKNNLSSFAQTSTIAFSAAAAGAFNFAQAASDAAETNSKFLTIFDEVDEKAQEFANNLASSYGLAQTEAEGLLASTGDLLTGLGFGDQAALDFSNSVQELAVDLASFQNLEGGATRASEALTKALLGETEAAKSLGIVISQDLIKAKIQELRLSGEITDQTEAEAKAIAVLALATQQSANALGDFARTQDQAANQQRIFLATAEDLRVELGKELLPLFTEGLKSLNKFAKGLRDNIKAAGGFGKFIKEITDNFKENNPILSAIVINLGKFLAVAIPLGAALGAITFVLSPLVGAFRGLLGVLQLVGPAIALLSSPIGLLVLGIGALVALVTTQFPEVGRVIVDALGSAGAVVADFFAFLTSDAVIGVLESFRDFFIDVFNALLPVITPIFQTIKDVIVTTISFINAFVRPIIEALFTFFQENFEGIKGIVVGAFEAIAGLISIPISIITGIIRTFLALIRGDFDGALQAIKDTFINVFNGIVGFVSGFFTTLANVVTVGWGVITAVFTAAYDTLGNITDGGLDFIKDGFSSVFDSIQNKVFEVFANIIKKAQDFIKIVTDIIDKIPGINIEEVGGLDFGGARAKGGPVSAGKAYLVGEQGPELIVPNSSGTVIPNNELTGGAGGAVTVNLTINGGVDSRGRVEQIIDEFKAALTNDARLNQLGL